MTIQLSVGENDTKCAIELTSSAEITAMQKAMSWVTDGKSVVLNKDEKQAIEQLNRTFSRIKLG
jgi:hypothetical protein